MPRRNKNGSRGKRTPQHLRHAESQKPNKKKKKNGQAQHSNNPHHKTKDAPHSRNESRHKGRNEERQGSSSSKNYPARPENLKSQIGQKFIGKIDVHPNGFGFVIADDKEIPNVYIPQEGVGDVLQGDRVEITISSKFEGGDKVRGQILRIVERRQKEFFGTLRLFKGGALIVPWDARDQRHTFKVDNEEITRLNLKNSSQVLAHITEYPSKGIGKVKIVEEVQNISSASQDTMRVLVETAWPRTFSTKALDEAKAAAHDWLKSWDKNKVDIQNLKFVTIDGLDARDFDDAVYAEASKNGWKIWVAIADVSHFVRFGTQLNKEAFARSTSVYFPDFVVPMLPEILSNDVCSLNPNIPRAALVCEFEISRDGKILHYKFFEALIKSHKRMTYELMQAYLEGKDFAVEECAPLKEALDAVIECYRSLNKAKFRRGALDLDLPEAKVLLNSDGTVKDIQTRQRLDAHKLIEDLMLAANECAAKFLSEKPERGGVYRIHEKPDQNRVRDLIKFVTLAGIEAPKALETAQDFSEYIEKIKKLALGGDHRAQAAQTMILRTMQQARYSAQALGHFALANPDYTHFTSPIRRYPDLLVHRLIRERLGLSKEAPPPGELEAMTVHCSQQERSAMAMEWKVIDLKKCRYMEPFIGQDFQVVVSGVIEKGIFCQIQDHFVDGLLNADFLHKRGRYRYDAATLSYRGPKGSLQLGSRITVKLVNVDILNTRIDFDLVEE
ncbi:MAG: ribonuclease R [Proteobacteria bacterium]|nr:ribonuclease R [Pseudomonadota bacterium]